MSALAPGVAVGGGVWPASGVVPHLAVSSLDVVWLVPLGCFVVFVWVLGWALCVAARTADEERELLALVDEQLLAPPLWGDVQGDPWPQRVPTLRDELEPINRGRAR